MTLFMDTFIEFYSRRFLRNDILTYPNQLHNSTNYPSLLHTLRQCSYTIKRPPPHPPTNQSLLPSHRPVPCVHCDDQFQKILRQILYQVTLAKREKIQNHIF